MDVSASHSHVGEISLEFLCHSLGQGSDQYSLVQFLPLSDLLQQVVDLVLCRSYLDRRIKQSCRTNHLLDNESLRFLQLIIRRSRADIYCLPSDGFEFIELQRSVICSCRQSESIFHEHGLPGLVTAVHSAYLRNRNVALVNECDEILREIVYQTERSHALAPAVEISRIVLDSRAVSHLLYELKIILDSLLQSLGLQMLAYALEILALRCHVVLDLAYRLGASLLRGHEVSGRIDGDFIKFFNKGSCERVNDRDLLDLVTEKLYAYGVFAISYADVDCVAFNSEGASLEVSLSAGI